LLEETNTHNDLSNAYVSEAIGQIEKPIGADEDQVLL
jgi:hypothetical protein